jgi:hypothetical protein
MADYMSPASFSGNTDIGLLPPGLQGYTMGQNRGIMDQILQRQFRDSDLANQGRQLEYEKTLADKPLQDANRDLGLAKTAADKANIDSGGYSAGLQAKQKEELSRAQLETAKAQLQKHELMGETAQGLDKELGPSIRPDQMATIRKQLSDAGLPDLPDDPLEARAAIHRAAVGYQQTGDRLKQAQVHLRAMEVERLRQTEATKRAEILANSRRDVQDKKNAAPSKKQDDPTKTMLEVVREGKRPLTDGEKALFEIYIQNKTESQNNRNLPTTMEAVNAPEGTPAGTIVNNARKALQPNASKILEAGTVPPATAQQDELGKKLVAAGMEVDIKDGKVTAKGGGPVKVQTPAQAKMLPSGTVFLTPDGKKKVVP